MRYAILLAALVGCSKPGPASPPAVYTELVEAGCIQPGADSLAAIQESLVSDAQPAWFACLADGGEVGWCGVPCE